MANRKEIQVEYKAINTQFNKAIKEVGTELSSLNKEFRLQKEQMKNTATDTEKLESSFKKLNKELEFAQQKTKKTSEAYEEAKRLTGENSNETRIWSDKLLDAQRNEEYLKNAVQQTSAQLDKQKASTKELTAEEKIAIESSQQRKDKLEELEQTSDDLSQSSDQLAKAYELENKEAGNAESGTKSLKREKEYLKKQIDLTKDSVQNLEKQLELAKEEYGDSSQEVKKLEDALLDAKIKNQDFTNSLKDAENGLKHYGEKMKNVGDKMTDVGKKMTIGLTLPIIAGVAGTVKAASDFETAFTGVKKTVDEAIDSNGKVTYSYEMLEEGIRNMAKRMPQSANDIAGVAEAAGQLGIKTEDVLTFTETMIMLGDSTNLSSEEAATSLARLANVTGLSADDYGRLGSTIVELGNNLATTEADIVNMATRLAGAGTQVGMTEAEILSMAGALSSVGIESEAGGSAFSKVMINMQLAAEKGGGALDDFAKVAGMSSEEFAKAYKDDATGALMTFIDGLSKSEERGISAIKVLDDMDIKEVRLRDSLLRAANASGVFTDALDIGQNAWEENTALTDEATKKYETFESKLKILKNEIVDIAIEFGGPLMDALSKGMEILKPIIEKVAELAKKFADASPEKQKLIIGIIAFVVALGPILTVVGTVISVLGSLSMMAGTLGVSIGALVAPFAIAAGIIAAVIAVGVLLWANWDTIKEKAAQLGEYLSEVWNSIKVKISEVWEGIKTLFSETWEAISNSATETWENIKNFFSETWEAISTKVTEVWTSISEFFSEIWEGIKNIFTFAFLLIQSIVEGAFLIIKTAIQVPLEFIRALFVTIWNYIGEWTTEKWNALKDVISTVTNAIKEVVTNVFNAIKEFFITIWNAIYGVIETVVNRIKDFYTRVFNAIRDKTTEIWNAISNKISEVWNSIKSKVTEAVNAVKNKVTEIWNAIKTKTTEVWNNIKAAVSKPIEDAKNAVTNTIDSLKTSVTNKFNEIKNSARDKFNEAKEAMLKPIEAAKTTISNIIDNIKGFFTGLKLKFPKIEMPKLPKFSLTGKFSLNPPSIPKLSVNWNAKGGIINDLAVFGNQGFGEKNPEAIVPLGGPEMNPFADAVAQRINQYSEVLSNVKNTQNVVINTYNTLTGSADEDRLVRKIDRVMKKKSNEASFAMGGV